MLEERAQQSEPSIIQAQSMQQVPIQQQDALKTFTIQTLRRIRRRELKLFQMPFNDLVQFHSGLALYVKDQIAFRDAVRQRIDLMQEKRPTSAEKSTNWFAAIGIIFVFLFWIVSGGIYTITQILSVETIWLKWLLIAIDLLIAIVASILVLKLIWPRRKIRYFDKLFNTEEEEK